MFLIYHHVVHTRNSKNLDVVTKVLKKSLWQ